MDNNSKGTRYIIDRIDNKLGSVEKELKFDKIAMGIGLGIMALFAFLMGVTLSSHPAIAIVFLMFAMFGFMLFYVMFKEYLADLRKAKQNKDGHKN